MANPEQLLQWCNEARDMLALSGSKKEKAAEKFDAVILRITNGPNRLNQLAPDSPLVKSMQAKFEALALEGHQLKAQVSTTGTEKEQRKAAKKHREAAKNLSTRMETLAGEIDLLIPVMQERKRYIDKMEDAIRRKDDLGTAPYGDATPLADLVNSAVLGLVDMDDAGKVKAKLKILEGFDAAEKLCIQKQKAGAEKAGRDAQAQREYLARQGVVAKAKERAAFLKHGVEAELLALTQALDKAGAKAKLGNYVQALEDLNAKGLATEAQLVERSQAAIGKSVGGPALKRLEDAIAGYEKLVAPEILQPEVLAARLAIDEALKTSSVDARAKLMGDAATLVEGKIRQANADKNQAAGLIESARLSIEQIKARVGVETRVALAGELERVKADLAAGRLADAVSHGLALEKAVAAAQVSANQDWGQWGRLQSSLPGLVSTLKSHANVVDATPEAKAASAALVLAGLPPRVESLISTCSWADLVELHASLTAGIKKFEDAGLAYTAFADGRASADKLVKAEAKGVSDDIGAARTRMGKKQDLDPAPVLAPFEERLKQQLSLWADRLTNATSAEALGAQARIDALKAIRTEVASATEEKGLGDLVKSQLTEAQRKVFDQEALTLGVSMHALEHLDTKKATAFADELAALRSATEPSFLLRMGPLADLKRRMALEVKEQEKNRGRYNGQMADMCNALLLRVQNVQNSLRSSGDKSFTPLLADMTEELADLRAQSGTPNKSVMDVTAARLQEMGRELSLLESGSGKDGPLARVRQELDRLAGSIEEAQPVLKTNLPKTLTTIQSSFKTLKTEVLSMQPPAALDEISSMRVGLNVARTQAGDVIRARQAYAELMLLVKEKLKVLIADDTLTAYVEQLKTRMTETDKLAKDPYKIGEAKVRLDKLHHDLETAIVNPAKGLEMQGKAQAEVEKQRLLKLQCETQMADIKSKGIARATKAIADAGGDEGMLKELGNMLEEAKGPLKAGNLADASRRLNLIDQRIAEIIADPHGPGIGSRKALPRDAALYAESARKLAAEITGFPSRARAAVSQGVETPKLSAALDKLGTQMTELSRRIMPDAFNELAQRLSDGKQPVRQRRELREQALLKINQTRALLREHPQFVALWNNPIHVELKVLGTELENRLVRLDANIRRCVQ